MSVSIVIGSQWGDEGKGKITDLMSPDFDIVARYQGGANAGHTIVWEGDDGEDEEFVLHLVPSGIFHEDVTCVIGNGVVLDPKAVLEEIEKIQSLGINVEDRLKISHNAHLIMPYHKAVEAAQEEERASASDDDEIGTTGRGIGPAYTDKFARTGIRVVDLLDRDVLRQKLRRSLEEKNAILEDIYDAEALDVERIVEEYVEFDQRIDSYVTDTSKYLCNALDDGADVLAGGAGLSLGRRFRELSLRHLQPSDRGRLLHRAGRASDGGRHRTRHRQSLLHPRGQRSVPDRARQRSRGGAAPERRGVRGHDGAAPPLWMARSRGASVHHHDQRLQRPGHHEAGRPLGYR